MSADGCDTARLVAQPLLLLALVCAAPFAEFYSGNMHEGLGFMDLGMVDMVVVGRALIYVSLVFSLASAIEYSKLFAQAVEAKESRVE